MSESAQDRVQESRGRSSGLQGVVGPIAAALLVGLALPLDSGWLVPALVVIALALMHERRSRSVAAWLRQAGGWEGALAALGARERMVLAALAVVAAIPFATVAVRMVSALVIAFPAAVWALAATLLGGVALSFARRRRARVAVMFALAAIIPATGLFGARFEAGSVDARGWAHTGPILGIHPWQTTAIKIDGHGPFDLPINDYVEPDGSRGYGPETLATALQVALRSIADLHYRDGPAQARLAFGEARVEAVTTAPVLERLDREQPETEHQRLHVFSGSVGQRSRVELVCPGQRNDPRPPKPDAVMNRMCPSKYASEASAGLGVTGRWAGYVEARGNERVGLSKWLGWTRSDDESGKLVVEWEHRLLAWAVLAIVALAVSVRRSRVAEGVMSVGSAGVVIAFVILLVLAAAWSADHMAVAAFERQPPWSSVFDGQAWLPALVLCFGFTHFHRPDDGEGPAADLWGRLRFAVVLVVSGLVASGLSSLTWIRPELWNQAGELGMQRFVEQLASEIALAGGASVQEIEGVLAAVLVATMLGLVAYLVVSVHRLGLAWPREPGAGPRAALLGPGLVLVAAACLVVSRKTEGASALIPGAIAVAFVLSSSVTSCARRSEGRPRWLAAAHIAWVVLGLVIVISAFARASAPGAMQLLLSALGGLTILGSLVFVLRPDGREPPQGRPGHDGGLAERPTSPGPEIDAIEAQRADSGQLSRSGHKAIMRPQRPPAPSIAFFPDHPPVPSR